MHPISEEVDKIVREIIGGKDPVLAEIIMNWSNITDPRFSESSYPLRISRYYEKGKVVGILYVKTDNAAISAQMNFLQESIIEKISIYMGSKFIEGLRFII
jgi:hypothetical protein